MNKRLKNNKILALGLIGIFIGSVVYVVYQNIINTPKSFKEPTLVSNKTNLTEQERQALRIAEEICKKEQWKWEDVAIGEQVTKKGQDCWLIVTNFSWLGGNASILIEKSTGNIVYKGFSAE